MKYWIAILGKDQNRLWFVSEKEETEPGLTRILRKEKFSADCQPQWISSAEIKSTDELYVHPVKDSTQKDYRCVLVGVEVFVDRVAIEQFAMNSYRVLITWIQVDESVFNWLQYRWSETVLDLLTNPNLDWTEFQESKDSFTSLSAAEKTMLRIGRHEHIRLTPMVRLKLIEKMTRRFVPTEIISFFCSEE
jgi:hypothetical protein